MRGEYITLCHIDTQHSELPPRARRIPKAAQLLRGYRGTTSACAENTWTASDCAMAPRNYLRVRGEYSFLFFLTI